MPTELEEVLTKSLQLAFQAIDVLAPESTEQGRPKPLRTNVDWLDTSVDSLDDLVCCVSDLRSICTTVSLHVERVYSSYEHYSELKEPIDRVRTDLSTLSLRLANLKDETKYNV